MRRVWTTVWAVVLVFVLLAMTGCQVVAEKAVEAGVEKATGVKVDAQAGSVTVKTKDGEATMSDAAKLPDDFPADVPMYDNGTVYTVMSNDVEGGKSYLVGMNSDDDAAKIHAWYKKALEDKGWKITSSMAVGDSVGGLNAEKGDLKANYAIGYGSDKKASISLTLMPNKKK